MKNSLKTDTPEDWDIMSEERQPGEDYLEYRKRLKLLKLVQKYYRRGVFYELRPAAGESDNSGAVAGGQMDS